MVTTLNSNTVQKNDPHFNDVLRHDKLTTDNKQIMNANDRSVWVGNPNIDALTFEFAGNAVSAQTILDIKATVDDSLKGTALFDFTGTSETTVTVPNLSNYRFILITLHSQTNNIISSMFLPKSTFMGYGVKLYGESSSQWGTVMPVNDTRVVFNRTSNTSQVRLLGYK